MKLYGKGGMEPSETQLTPFTSLESFIAYHATAEVLSMESVQTFLGQLKDVFNNAVKTFSLQPEEKFITETLADRYQISAKIKEIRLGDIRYVTISKPESFKGFYLDYLKDLESVGKETLQKFEEALPYVKTAVASFINEYSDVREDNIYGYHKLKKTDEHLKKMVKTIGDYFTLPSNKVKTTPPEVLKSLQDLNEIYAGLDRISREVINPELFTKMQKEVKNVADLVDHLIQHNITTGVLLKNNAAKRELIECLSILAHLTEFYASLYAHLLALCSALQSLTSEVKGHVA